MKIIVHIDEMQKWSMVLNNVTHLNEFYTDTKDQIEILVNGDAVNGLRLDGPEALSIEKTLNSNNLLVACQNSLNQRAILPAEILSITTLTSSGVVELVEKQSQGFYYIRP